MANIKANTDKDGHILSYRFRACIGRDERGKQLWATTTVPRPDGLTPARERKEVERLADQWEEEQREAMRIGQVAPNKTNISFRNFAIEHWFPNAVEDGSHAPQTVDFYRHMLTDLTSYFGPKIELKQVGVESIKRYLKYLQTEARTKNGELLSLSSQKHHYDVLRIILRYALRVGYLRDDPTRRLLVSEKPRTEKKSIDFLSQEDTKRFLECLEKEPLFWRCLENTLIFTGIRRGECIGLQWRDLDIGNLCLSIERNVTLDEQAPEKFHIGKTKTGTTRIVPISKRLCDLLLELRSEREAMFGAIGDEGFIFCKDEDPYQPIYPSIPTHWQRRFVKRNQLPNISPHGLRHTAASLALESGANIKQVQLLLGHADAATTLRFYTGVSDSAQRRAVEGIESLLEKK